MTTIDHAGALAVSRPDTFSDEHVAGRALQVARRTALGVLGDAEAAADIAQDVMIDPETSDILQSTEVMAPPPASLPNPPAGVRKPPWPPPAWLAERTQVFVSTGSVAALGERP
jgi:hypothetical protein